MLALFTRTLLRLRQPITYAFSKRLPSFTASGLLPALHSYLEEQGMHTPSSIQEKALAQLMKPTHHNYYIIAPTGTGKTLAYLLPTFNTLKLEEQLQQKKLTQPNRPRCLIIVSSKELVEQVADVAKQLSHHCKMRVVGLTGGLGFKQEKELLDKGVDVLVSTLDRVDKHREHLFLGGLSHLIIDELDTLIDASFAQQLQKYIEAVKKRQLKAKDYGQQPPKILLVSATFTKAIDSFFGNCFRWYERDPNFYRIEELEVLERENAMQVRPGEEFALRKIVDKNTHFNLQHIKHEFVHCTEADRHQPLYSQVMLRKKSAVMVFCNTVASLHELEYFLNERKVETVSLHGDLPRPSRQANIHRFRGRTCNVLLCTDLGSRGLDFPFLEYVINYDFPRTVSDYLHRAGRTGRAGKSGTVITLYHNKHLKFINQLKSAHTSNKPLDVRDSAYSLTNKEMMTGQVPSKQRAPRKAVKQRKSLKQVKQSRRKETLRQKRFRTSH